MIRYVFGVGGITLVFFVLVTISLAMMTGASVGYAVEDRDDAEVGFNGTHFSVGTEEPREVLPPADVPISDYEPESTEPHDQEHEQPAELEELELLGERVDEELETPRLDYVLDNTLGGVYREAMATMFTAVSVLGTEYAGFFVDHRDRIPERVATAYVAAYMAAVWSAFLYVKVNGIRRAIA